MYDIAGHLCYFSAVYSSDWDLSHKWVELLQLPNEMPAQTCSDAKENGLYYGESIPTPPPGPDPLPFPKELTIEPPESLPTIKFKGKSISVREFMPDDLAFQPFEGYPEDIGRIGQVLRDADAGKQELSHILWRISYSRRFLDRDKLDVFYKPDMEI